MFSSAGLKWPNLSPRQATQPYNLAAATSFAIYPWWDNGEVTGYLAMAQAKPQPPTSQAAETLLHSLDPDLAHGL